MKNTRFALLLLCLLLLISIGIPGAYALWQYAQDLSHAIAKLKK